MTEMTHYTSFGCNCNVEQEGKQMKYIDADAFDEELHERLVHPKKVEQSAGIAAARKLLERQPVADIVNAAKFMDACEQEYQAGYADATKVHENTINALQGVIHQLKAERDEAVGMLAEYPRCSTCAHGKKTDLEEPCRDCRLAWFDQKDCKWEWGKGYAG